MPARWLKCRPVALMPRLTVGAVPQTGLVYRASP
jgi:hypothetical protein